MPDWRSVAGELLLAAVVLHSGPGVAEDALDRLLESLASQGTVVVRFEEERHIGLLERPLRSWGTLSFTPPDRLIKQTLAPTPSLFRADRETLTIVDDTGEQQIPLASHPLFAAYIAPFRAVLSGERAGLERHFSADLESGPAGWTLVLEPRAAEVARQIDEVIVAGEADRIRTIEIREQGGDRAILRLDEPG